MNIDPQTIDRIVAGVLNQLSAGGDGAPVGFTTETRRHGGRAAQEVSREALPSVNESGGTTIDADVVTADVLLEHLGSGSTIVVPQRAIVTPAAWDVARAHDIEILRNGDRFHGSAAHLKWAAKPTANTSLRALMIIVRFTDALGRLCDDLDGQWRRELSGCSDDAAALAVSSICRGDASRVVIFAAQSHRAACLANRNERVKAVAIHTAGDVPSVRSQLRANVWCIDPADRSWFELRNLVRAVAAPEAPR